MLLDAGDGLSPAGDATLASGVRNKQSSQKNGKYFSDIKVMILIQVSRENPVDIGPLGQVKTSAQNCVSRSRLASGVIAVKMRLQHFCRTATHLIQIFSLLFKGNIKITGYT